jgi:uncharacterized DUF497 family protein
VAARIAPLNALQVKRMLGGRLRRARIYIKKSYNAFYNCIDKMLTKGIHNRKLYDMSFYWNEEKNVLLKQERGVSFERIVVAIEEGHLLDVLEHPNKEKYKNQIILVVEIEDYAFCIPCVVEANGNYFMKTLYPSRKYTKQYNLGGSL